MNQSELDSMLRSLVSECDAALARREYKEAGVIARTYARKADALADVDSTAAKVLLAYSYLMICKSVLGMLESAPAAERSKLLEAFYACFHVGFRHFHDLLRLSTFELDTSSPHFPYFKQFEQLDETINDRYGSKDCTEAARIASERLRENQGL